MKKKELGITKGEVKYVCSADYKGIFYKVTGESESICNVTTRNGDRAELNANFIADAFNTANKCGLLPSELLEQNQILLSALKRIESIYDWVEDSAGAISHSTINKIEQ